MISMASKPRFSGERVSFSDAFEEISKGVAKYKQADYLETGIYPIVDQGRFAIAGYTNAAEGVCSNVPAIVFGDHTRIVKYVDTPFCAGADGVKILKPRLSSNVRFWYHALRSAKIDSLGYSRHFKLLKGLSFVCPQESEQDCICQKLDSVLDLIFLQEAEISWLNDLVKSRFIEMFGDFEENPKRWPICSFGEFARIDTHMTNDLDRYSNMPHVGIDSIESGTGRLFGYRTVAEDGVRSGKYPFGPLHIIYSKIRPALNKVAIPGFEGVCSADAYPILPNRENCDRVFLAYAMRSSFFLEYILPLSTRAQMPKVNKEALEGFAMPLPPLSLQREFAGFAREVDKLEFMN